MKTEIFIEQLKTEIRIGCGAEEKKKFQTIEIDVVIEADTTLASKTANIADTICYKKVCELIQNLAAEREYTLLEEFGDFLLSSIFSQFPRAQIISLSLKKFVIKDANGVGVKITKARM